MDWHSELCLLGSPVNRRCSSQKTCLATVFGKVPQPSQHMHACTQAVQPLHMVQSCTSAISEEICAAIIMDASSE